MLRRVSAMLGRVKNYQNYHQSKYNLDVGTCKIKVSKFKGDLFNHIGFWYPLVTASTATKYH
jgi:hypothetical protein